MFCQKILTICKIYRFNSSCILAIKNFYNSFSHKPDNNLLNQSSLRSFRIFMGIALVINLVSELRYVEVFYSSSSLSAVNPVDSHFLLDLPVSLLSLNDSIIYIYIFFLMSFMANVAYMIGYRIKLSTLVSLIFLISIQYKSRHTLNGGDYLLSIGMVWSLFILSNKKNVKTYFASTIFQIGYIFQLACMYFVAGLSKSGNDWKVTFSAIEKIYSLEGIANNFGEFLLGYPAILKYISAVIPYYELLISALVIIAGLSKMSRYIVFLMVFVMQIGIAITLNLGIFPLTSMVVMIPLLPKDAPLNKMTSWAVNLFKNISIARLISRHVSTLHMSSERYKYKDSSKLQKLNKKVVVLARPANLLLSFMMIFMILSSTVYSINTNTSGGHLVNLGLRMSNIFYLSQDWRLFGPDVASSSSWPIIEAELRSGERVDLWRSEVDNSLPQRTDFIRPYDISNRVGSVNYRKYFDYIQTLDISEIKETSFGDYFCNLSKDKYGLDAKSISFYVGVSYTHISQPAISYRGKLLCVNLN